MSPLQQVKLFAKQNIMIINADGGVPMFYRKFPAGAMWIECFDDYKDALAFFTKHQNAFINNGVDTPWCKPNHQ